MNKIVCLCGSTRFYEAFQEANYRRTMAGEIVLSVGFYPHAVDKAHGEHVGVTPEQKEKLDNLHFRKIAMAHEIFVLNVDGYVGASTAREIAYAVFTHVPIVFLDKERGEELLERRSHEIGKMVAVFMSDHGTLVPPLPEWPEKHWRTSVRLGAKSQHDDFDDGK